MCIAVNAPEMFCVAHLANIERFYTILTLHLNTKIYMHVNLPDRADENQLKCEKMLFLSEMSEINSR